MVKSDDIASRVRRVFSLVLQRPIGADEEIFREQESEWDSLRHMEILFAVEEEFDCRFTEDELAALGTLSAVISEVTTKSGS